MKAAMAGVPLQQSATAPAAAWARASFLGGFAPVARFGRGGGGISAEPGKRRIEEVSRESFFPADPDDEALDFSRLTSNSVRLIDDQQNMIGVVPLEEAIQRAEDAALDLVILSADADPPVLRIVDYNKYRYEQQKKKKDQQKKSAASRMDMKEIKMGYNIDSHDYGVRLRAAQRFLNDGDKVKVIVNLKRRENDFRDMAIELLKRFQEDVGELGTEESHNFSDRNVFLVLVPNKLVAKKSQPEPGKKKEAAPTAEVPANP